MHTRIVFQGQFSNFTYRHIGKIVIRFQLILLQYCCWLRVCVCVCARRWLKYARRSIQRMRNNDTFYPFHSIQLWNLIFSFRFLRNISVESCISLPSFILSSGWQWQAMMFLLIHTNSHPRERERWGRAQNALAKNIVIELRNRVNHQRRRRRRRLRHRRRCAKWMKNKTTKRNETKKCCVRQQSCNKINSKCKTFHLSVPFRRRAAKWHSDRESEREEYEENDKDGNQRQHKMIYSIV